MVPLSEDQVGQIGCIVGLCSGHAILAAPVVTMRCGADMGLRKTWTIDTAGPTIVYDSNGFAPCRLSRVGYVNGAREAVTYWEKIC